MHKLLISRESRFVVREGHRGNEFNAPGLPKPTILYPSAPTSPAHQSIYYLILRLSWEEPVAEKNTHTHQAHLLSIQAIPTFILMVTRVKLSRAGGTMLFPWLCPSPQFQSQSRKRVGQAGAPGKCNFHRGPRGDLRPPWSFEGIVLRTRQVVGSLS